MARAAVGFFLLFNQHGPAKHAEQELQRRQIPRDLVDGVLAHPQQIVPERGGKQAWQSQVDFGGGRIYLIRAIVGARTDPPVVVTVYRTSKIEKYWRTQ